MIVMIVKLKSTLSDEEMGKVVVDRLPAFQKRPGLIQKYYSKPMDMSGRYAGIYLWDSMESVSAYQLSDLYHSLRSAYCLSEPPEIELFEVGLHLREDN